MADSFDWARVGFAAPGVPVALLDGKTLEISSSSDFITRRHHAAGFHVVPWCRAVGCDALDRGAGTHLALLPCLDINQNDRSALAASLDGLRRLAALRPPHDELDDDDDDDVAPANYHEDGATSDVALRGALDPVIVDLADRITTARRLYALHHKQAGVTRDLSQNFAGLVFSSVTGALDAAVMFLGYSLEPGQRISDYLLAANYALDDDSHLRSAGLCRGLPSFALANISHHLPYGCASRIDAAQPVELPRPLWCTQDAPERILGLSTDVWFRSICRYVAVLEQFLKFLDDHCGSASATAIVTGTVLRMRRYMSDLPSTAQFLKVPRPGSGATFTSSPASGNDNGGGDDDGDDSDGGVLALFNRDMEKTQRAVSRLVAELCDAPQNGGRSDQARLNAIVGFYQPMLIQAASLCTAGEEHRESCSRDLLGSRLRMAPGGCDAGTASSATRHAVVAEAQPVVLKVHLGEHCSEHVTAPIALALAETGTSVAFPDPVTGQNTVYGAVDFVSKLMHNYRTVPPLAWQLAGRVLQLSGDELGSVTVRGNTYTAAACYRVAVGAGGARQVPAALLELATMPRDDGDGRIDVGGVWCSRVDAALQACRYAQQDQGSAWARVADLLGRKGTFVTPAGETVTAWTCAQKAIAADCNCAAGWRAVATYLPPAADDDDEAGFTFNGVCLSRIDCARTAVLLNTECALCWCALAHVLPWPETQTTTTAAANHAGNASSVHCVRVGSRMVSQLDCFQQAVKLDARCGRAWAGLAQHLRHANITAPRVIRVRIGNRVFGVRECETKAMQCAVNAAA